MKADQRLRGGSGNVSGVIEAAGETFRNLAGVEHRLAILLPELRLHDKRMKIKIGAQLAAQESKLQQSASANANAMVQSNLKRAATVPAKITQIGEIVKPPPSPPPHEKKSGHGGEDGSPTGSHKTGSRQPSPDGKGGSRGASPDGHGRRSPSPDRAPSASSPTGRNSPPPQLVTSPPSFSSKKAPPPPPPPPARAPSGLPVMEMHHLTEVIGVVANKKSSSDSLNVRVLLEDYEDGGGGGGPGGSKKPTGEAAQKDREFLWKVFQAFDTDKSGVISTLEVRALFDRVALEQTYAARGQSSGDKLLKAATKFCDMMFEDSEDTDGKLGKEELDRFFVLFQAEESKMITWDEFVFHAVHLMQSMREREVMADEAKQHVPTREELKESSSKAKSQHEKELRRQQRASVAGLPATGGTGKASTPQQRPMSSSSQPALRTKQTPPARPATGEEQGEAWVRLARLSLF